MTTKQVTKTVFYLKHIEYNFDAVADTDYADSSPGEYLILGKGEVTFDILLTGEELLAAKVLGLEKQAAKLRADTQVKLNIINDKIQSLLAITDQSETEEKEIF